MQRIGKLIQQARKRSGMSQAELARRMKVDPPSITQYEKAKNMEILTLARIAKALGVTVSEILQENKH